MPTNSDEDNPQAVPSGRWSLPDPSALEDFCSCYERHYDVVEARAEEWARARAPLAGTRLSKEDLRQALFGDWSSYGAALQAQGAAYAETGVALGPACAAIRAFSRHLTPCLVEEYHREPSRLSAAIQVMQDFADHSVATLAESYIEHKEGQLRARENDLATTLDSIGDAVIVTDERGAVTRMNPVAERLIGKKLAECQSRPLADVFHIEQEETGEPVESPVPRVLREGTVVGLANHTVLLGADGARRPIADSAAPVRREDGSIRGVVLVFRDVTEDRRAEEKLRYWERIFQHANWGVALATIKDVRFQAVNPAYAKMHGYTVEELVGAPVSTLWAPETRADMEAAAHETLERDHLVAETTHICKDGRRLPVEVVATTIKNARGEITSFVANVRDMTDRKRLELARAHALELETRNRRTEEANRLKSEFLANMSHELRTPLNAVIGFSELIRDGHAGPITAMQEEFLDDILSSGRHLLTLINEVLDLAKVESGKMEFRPEPVELGDLVRKVVQTLRATASEKAQTVDVSVSEELTEIVLDPARFKQILYNYLSNALKFTPKGGKVQVRAEPAPDGCFLLEIEDTGPGIPVEEVPRLFTAFQQLDSSAAKRHAGTGLGLALTKRLVEAQNGTVGVRPAPTGGSIFFAVLPRQSTGPEGEACWVAPEGPHDLSTGPGDSRGVDRVPDVKARASSLPPIGGEHTAHQDSARTVLVLDDDVTSLRLMRAQLAELGYEASCFSRPHDALLALESMSPLAIIVDIIMPELDGLKFLERLRTYSRHKNVRVMLWTVKDITEAERRDLETRVDMVVRKGVGDGFRLSAALRAFLPLPIQKE